MMSHEGLNQILKKYGKIFTWNRNLETACRSYTRLPNSMLVACKILSVELNSTLNAGEERFEETSEQF